jgi:hypothetical protein
VLLGALGAGARLARPLGPPPAPAAAAPAARVVVASLADEVRAGRAAVAAPTGAALGPDRFLDVRPLAVRAQDRPLRDAGARPRRWLYAHPPAAVAVEVDVPRGEPAVVRAAPLTADRLLRSAAAVAAAALRP